MVRKICALIILMLVWREESFAQIEKDTVSIPRIPFILENINDIDLNSQITIANIGEDIFGAQLQFLTDDIERTFTAPVQLRTASWKDLQSIPTLTDLDIYKILKNRKEGNISNADISSRAKFFITKSPVRTKSHFSFRSRVVLDPDASKQAVYQNGTYQGSPIKTTTRIIAKSDDILFSMTEAKNPGEPLYFDHLTGCVAATKPIAITDNVSLSKCVLGDYSLSFGSGLLLTSGYSQLPTSDVNSSIVPRAGGIKPYISSSGFRYFQGAAAEISSGMFSAIGFFSDRKIDAKVDSNRIISLSPSIYHRTASELARKDQAENKVTGGHVAVTPLSDDAFLEFGATAYTLNYDKPVIAKDSLSGFSGMQHSMISADMRGAFSFISWSGEFARMISDAGRANAFAMSVITAPSKILEISLNYRDLPANFISPFGGTFGINSTAAQNENGWYIGSKLFVIPERFLFFGSANFSKSESATTGEVRYSDIRLGSKYILKSFPLRLALQLRSYGKGAVFAITNDTLAKKSFLFDADGDITKSITLSLRAEFQQTPAKQTGNLIGVGIEYLPVEEFSVASGVSFFQTDSYAVRFYSNESDLPGSSPFVALYGKGYRYYLLLSYDLSAAFTFSARIAQTNYSLAGSSQIHKTSVGAQCDVSF